MAFFGLGKKRDDVIDLSERYRRRKENADMSRALEEKSSSDPGVENASMPFAFFGASNSTSSSNSDGYSDLSAVQGQADDRRKKLAKRILDLTSQVEDLSNQIYHLQQRIEVLERRLR